MSSQFVALLGGWGGRIYKVDAETLCQHLLWASMCFVSIIFAACGSNKYFNFDSLGLGLGLMLIMLAMLRFGGKHIQGLTVMVSFTLYVAVMPGLCLLIVFPDHITPPLPLTDATQLNAGLAYVYIGLVAIVAGMLVQDWLFSKRSRSKSMMVLEDRVNVGDSFVIPIIAVLLIFALSRLPFSMGLSQYLVASEAGVDYNVLLQIFVLLFDPESAILLAFVFIARSSSGRNKQLIAVAVITAAYIAVSVWGGSRSGILRLVTYALLTMVVLDMRPTLSLRVIVIGAAAIALVALLAFWVGTGVRLYQANVLPTEAATLGKWSERLQSAYPSGAGLGIANRTAAPLFYGMLATTAPYDESARARFFNAEYVIKNLINNVPGTPYPEAFLNTSRVFGIVYRGLDEGYILQQKGYFSELYTIWGIARLHFGGVQPFLFMVLMGGILGFIVSQARSIGGRFTFVYMWALWVLPGAVIITAGVDHSIWLILVSFLRMTITWFILLGAVGLARRFRFDNKYVTTR